MSLTYDFAGQVALVTGASAGMGLAAAQAFAAAGAAVVLSDVNEKLLQTITQELTAAGHKALAVKCDLAHRSPGSLQEIAAAVLWLCSPAASFVVGAALKVDGGFTAH